MRQIKTRDIKIDERERKKMVNDQISEAKKSERNNKTKSSGRKKDTLVSCACTQQ